MLRGVCAMAVKIVHKIPGILVFSHRVNTIRGVVWYVRMYAPMTVQKGTGTDHGVGGSLLGPFCSASPSLARATLLLLCHV